MAQRSARQLRSSAKPSRSASNQHQADTNLLTTVGLENAASVQQRLDLHTGGLRADLGAARWLKGARAGQRVDRRGSYDSV